MTATPSPPSAPASARVALGAAVFASGTAALVNQVVWQRGLKIFLGGSETLASTIVVLVFMLGLGAGSLWAGRRSAGLRNPLAAVAAVELLLSAVNLAVAGVLASDLRTSVVQMRIAADAVGVPMELAYAGVSVLVLVPPCFLMGMTTPFAAEAFQRQLHLRSARLLGWLFFANTVGSVVGAVGGSGWMLPRWGQLATLGAAAGANLACAAVCVVLARRGAAAPIAVEGAAAGGTLGRPELVLSALLGGISLGYELLLFRMVALAHTPTPYVFAAALSGFLLWWSAGAALASGREVGLGPALRLGALAVVGALLWHLVGPRPTDLGSVTDLPRFLVLHVPLFLPSLAFGYGFSTLAARCRASWGAGVGGLYLWNTVGAAAGIVLTTAVGLSLPLVVAVLVAAAALAGASELADGARRRGAGMLATVAVAALASRAIPWNAHPLVRTALYGHPGHVFQSHAGVIEVRPTGDLVWDGLWHSSLSRNGDHVGTNNWFLAVAPLLAHRDGRIDEALVIGLGTGVTAATLARDPAVGHVTVYDINGTIAEVLERFPEGTLRVAELEKVDIVWADGRASLALRPATYDLVQTQPMWLKQAGSTLLNSIEFYRLVASRLRPGGVFCLYANGTAAQSHLVRQTARAVFPYGESFFDGYLLVLSNDPIDLSEDKLARFWRRPGPVWDEIRGYPATATPADFLRWRDDDLAWGAGSLVASDDHPILEYPEILAAVFASRGLHPEQWPPPQPPWGVTQAWITERAGGATRPRRRRTVRRPRTGAGRPPRPTGSASRPARWRRRSPR